MTSACLAAALVATNVFFNAEEHSVSFTARAVGMPTTAHIEFLLAGPDSDHDYESLFLTDAEVGEIADAFEKAGIPLGKPIDPASARLWPVGEHVEMSPAFSELIRETYGEPLVPACYTGGSRDSSGRPDAATNMPLAVFALYSMPQALIQLDDALDQSATYGRFRPAKELEKGERRLFTFKWNGRPSHETVAPRFEKENVAEVLASLKEKVSKGLELDVTPSVSPAMTLKEATALAGALSVLDSRAVKINGCAEGELFYQAYLPKESWRDRTQRLCQPPEVHLSAADASYTVCEILEDWSGEGTLDPKLTVKEHRFEKDADAGALVASLADRTQTVIVYADAGTKLERLYALKKAVGAAIPNWYVFAE